MQFEVKREHYGDKFYQAGDMREANLSDVQHLIQKGVLIAAEELDKPKPKTTKAAPKQVKEE